MLRSVAVSCFPTLRQLAGAVGFAVLAGLGSVAVYESAMWTGPSPKPDVRTSSAVLYEDDFLKDLKAGRYFKTKGTGSSVTIVHEGRSNLGAAPERHQGSATPAVSFGGSAYRTVCVRLCDGAYFPISTSTAPGRFAADEAACQSRCNSPARLYVYKNNSGSPETMVDLKGKSYSDLPNAFLFRSKYQPSCQCKPHPWEEAARQRHRYYALAEWKSEAERLARLEKSKAEKQKLAVRAVRLWLKTFQQALATGDAAARHKAELAARRTLSVTGTVAKAAHRPPEGDLGADPDDARAERTPKKRFRNRVAGQGQPYGRGWRRNMYSAEN